jgi:dipeptidyl aminopeptidase/acylaminoacyl peptidase
MSRRLARIAFALTFTAASPGVAETGYQKPPPEVLEVLHAPLPPSAVISPTHDTLLLEEPVRYPPISVVAEPMYRLAGVRVSPVTHGVHAAPYWSSADLVRLADGQVTHVALPSNARISLGAWSADGQHYAFSNIGADSIELWVGEPGRPAVRQIPGVRLNPILGDELQWMPDQKTLLVKLVPSGLGPPAQPPTPPGPDVQETSGSGKASSTYEVRDVLKGPHDEELFDYYAQSQLALVDVASGQVTPIGPPALYTGVGPSPDGQYLAVDRVHRPYSHLTTWERFPREADIWSRDGKPVQHIGSLPLAESVPIWGVPTGPRDFFWRASAPAQLVWAEALDGGDWKNLVSNRDRLMTWKAPFDGKPAEVLRTLERFESCAWGDQDRVLVNEFNAIKHWTQTYLVAFDHPGTHSSLIWSQSTDEKYKHPGAPVLRTLPNGFRVLEQDGDSIWLSGVGSSPDGDRPFLDRLDLKTLKTVRLFRSDKTSYEIFGAWLDRSKGRFLTRRETPRDPPNYYVRTLGDRVALPAEGEAAFASTPQPITHLTDPAPAIRGITKRLVKYKRDDGVDLSFILYLPPGYKEGTRLPAVLWAYPLDYADQQVAGQVAGSTQRFTVIGWPLQLFFLLEGYAVIDNPSLPVVGDANRIYDTYMEQLVSGARAAVDKAVELGVVDRDRIGVMGHSHGGLMTVNLLANTDLFRAGIARSGAYNRSLTAFGFQNERRTLWEATDVYVKVSPFFHADHIKSPLLLIHGEADMNPGTEPIQSEKLFEAIRGNGGTARLVMLPFESHGYAAMESNEHVLYEMLQWFDRYVKNAPHR